MDFTMKEMNSTFKKLSNTSPGIDKIFMRCFDTSYQEYHRAFNWVINQIPLGVRGSLFGDDLVLYTAETTAVEVVQKLKRAINAISSCTNKHGFVFSSPKTSIVQFTRVRRQKTSQH
ncbi:hypothetical protein SK128_016885 [Halocaridina rubra]|uniref:Reverse transcriptase domain-containing protein n=1 Tax=Halocaridina rubra TaxID=373956 RepID=A0AAN8XPX6_HALRR